MWRAMLTADPRCFEAAWKLALADYWLGGHAPDPEQRTFFEQGIEAGRKAVAVQPNRPEGHFWIAANMGALAESSPNCCWTKTEPVKRAPSCKGSSMRRSIRTGSRKVTSSRKRLRGSLQV
jgi:hypothetical protein